MNDQTILLVEDNSNDVTLALLAFEEIKFPYHVAVASDGVEALDYLFGTGKHAGNKPATPVLVVLDLNLPKVNGLEVLKKIRNDPWLKSLPVVILTSSDEDRDKKAAKDLKVDLFLRKAVDFNDFVLVVKKMEGLIPAST